MSIFYCMIQKFIVFILFFLISMPVYGMYTGEKTKPDPAMSDTQFIVTYKTGQDPDTLNLQLKQRAKIRQNILGTFKLYFSDLSNPNTPEKLFVQMKAMDRKVGITMKEPYVDSNNTYLITVTKKSDILKTIEQYKQLPMVKDAQPNYFYYIMSL